MGNGEQGVSVAIARPKEGAADPVGELKLVNRRDAGTFHVLGPLTGRYAKLAPLIAEIENEDPGELALGLQLLKEGNYEAVRGLPHWQPIAKAGLIHAFAEAIRSQIAQVTSPAGLALGQAAATASAEGREEGVPFSKVLTTGAMTTPGSVRAELALQQRLTLPSEEREPFKPRKGKETVEGLTQKILNILRDLGVLRGLVVAEGAEEEKLLQLEEIVNEILNDPLVRKQLFGDDFRK